MKVLIISDDKDDIAFVDSFMKNKGYDVIVYQWLIKAMDNLEEIKPNIVIVNSKEYPRRWKTLASFLQSGLGGDNVKLYLYEPEPLSEEDKEKAKALGIEAFIPVLDYDTMEKYFSSFDIDDKPDKNDSDEINETEQYIIPGMEDFSQKSSFGSQIIITNPNDGSLLSGKVLSFSENVFECKVSSDNLTKGQVLQYVSIYYNDKVSYLSTYIKENNKEKGTLSLSVCEYYEEI